MKGSSKAADSHQSALTQEGLHSSWMEPSASPDDSPQAPTSPTPASSPESMSSCETASTTASELPSWFPLGTTIQHQTPTSWLATIAWLIKWARGMALAQVSLVWLIATASAGLASCTGFTIITFLIITRRYAPATVDYVRPLHFDYTAKDGQAVAISPLAQGLQAGGSTDLLLPALPGARFLPSGQQIELWVELNLPETERNQGVFQLVGEMLAADSRVVARSSRPFMLKHQSPLVKMIRSGFALPWAVIGLYDESVQLQLHLFDSFEEREAYPVAYFRATLLPAAGNAPLPLLYNAVVHIRLKLGFLQWVLYYLRPSFLVSWALAVAGASLLAGGSASGLLLLAVAVLFWYASKDGQSKVKQAQQIGMDGKAAAVLHPIQQLTKKGELEEIESLPTEREDDKSTMSERSDEMSHFTTVDASSSRSHTGGAGKHLDSMPVLLRRRSGTTFRM